MEKITKIKLGIILALSIIFDKLGILAVPVFVLVGCNIIDYATGLIASPYRHQEIKSYKSFRGIAKKICMWLLVVVGWFLDTLIKYEIVSIGLQVDMPYIIATLAAVWLITNEMISILENMVDIGVKIPPFLLPLIKYIRNSADKKIMDALPEDEAEQNNNDKTVEEEERTGEEDD